MLLIEYILEKIQEEGYINNNYEEINIPQAIQDDSDWILDDLDIELAIQQDKTWNIIINNDIQQLINQDKNWEDN
jgi:hypothetical protein